MPLALVLTLGSIATTAISTRLPAQAVLTSSPPVEGRRIMPALPSPKPVVITSDSVAFCLRLSRVIESYHNGALPRAVSQLREEGTDLCRHGLVRPGLIRLRRAIVSLKRTTP
ncbi:hypothetical protein [Acetobacter malorum]|uniref:hypothetical protein n=1 Tax=Acetobacter malorum TaxID=178901 RepID=UPI0012E916EE|nr:hypothetical protein [Acetobacter malorum]